MNTLLHSPVVANHPPLCQLPCPLCVHVMIHIKYAIIINTFAGAIAIASQLARPLDHHNDIVYA